jgi:hypothetical protein
MYATPAREHIEINSVELDVPARFSTGVGIERPMLSNIARSPVSSSADAWRELLARAVVESSNEQRLTTIGEFQLGISRMSSGRSKLEVGIMILLASAQKQIEW